MDDGTYRDLFGYSSDIQPKEVDPVQVRFEGDKGEAICFYHSCKGVGGELVTKLNHAFPSAYFEKISGIVNYSSNIEWVERQILQHVLAKICGVEYVLNEGGASFAKRVEPYEWRWRRQQC